MPSDTDDNLAQYLSPRWVIKRRTEGYPTRTIKIKASHHDIQWSSVVAPATEDSNTDMVVDILQDTRLWDGWKKVFRRTTAELFCPVGCFHPTRMRLSVEYHIYSCVGCIRVRYQQYYFMMSARWESPLRISLWWPFLLHIKDTEFPSVTATW